MIAPQPFKLKCPKCRYTKVIKPKSDVITPEVLINSCPKCGSRMEKVPLNLFDKIFS